jgi:indole-3-glycerol phosphate synthase
MKFLSNILEEKWKEVARARIARPLAALQASGKYHRPIRSLLAGLTGTGFGIIAEVKKASPSKGVIREQFDPVELALSYRDGGAVGLSVLTDEKFFQGSLSYLENIRDVVDLPLLRKDFIVDPYQIHEARAAGADAILLIVAALTPEELLHLQSEAESIGLECLVEVHTEAELSIAASAGARLIGINNRDLETFETDIAISEHLATLLPGGVVGIGESAIRTSNDLALLKACGLHGALVGEALMSAENPGRELGRMIAGMQA